MSTAYEQRGDPVLDWNIPSLQFKIIGPLAGFDLDPIARPPEEEKKAAAVDEAPKMT